MNAARMKYFLPISLFLLICFPGFGQSPAQFTYHGMYGGYVEANRKKTGFEDIVAVDLELLDSIYLINLYVHKDREHSERVRFMGFYSLDSKGNLKLKGEHPFQESDYVIRKGPLTETPEEDKRYNYLQQFALTFQVKLQEKWTGKKPQKMELEAIKKNYKYSPGLFENHTYSYMPQFYPGYYYVFRKKEDQDSVFKLVDNKQKWISYSKQTGESCDPKYEQNYLKVDSIKFDTIYVNKLLKTKNCFWGSSVDTINLRQPLKIQLDYSRMPFTIEDRELFAEPGYASEIVYTKEEMDRIQSIRIKKYVKDAFGIEWINIEVDVSVYDEASERNGEIERYNSKTVSGWIFQKGLEIY